MSEKIFPLILSFILTTGFGGILGHWLKQRSWRLETGHAPHRARYDEGIKFLDALSDQAGRRSFLLQRYFLAIERYPARCCTEIYQAAITWCHTYGVKSERAVALMFDIRVQNGSIANTTRAQIERDFAALDPGVDADSLEIARLRVIANRRAEAADPRWIEDVRARKLTIANGTGNIHGAYYDLEEQYGIGLKPVVD